MDTKRGWHQYAANVKVKEMYEKPVSQNIVAIRNVPTMVVLLTDMALKRFVACVASRVGG